MRERTDRTMRPDQEDVSKYVEAIITTTSDGRIHQLPDDLSSEASRAILEELKKRGEHRAVASHIGEFLDLEERDFEWLFQNQEYLAIADKVRRGIHDPIKWITRFAEADLARAAEYLLGKPEVTIAAVPGIVADTLLQHERVRSIMKYVGKFQEDSLSEAVALALIQEKEEGVGALMYNTRTFKTLTQRVFDALYEESELLLASISRNLSHFKGLNESAKDLLIAAGYETEVEENSTAFQ